MIRNIRRNQRVITEITEFNISPYTQIYKIICEGIDADMHGPRLSGIVCGMNGGGWWVRWSNNTPSNAYRTITELIKAHPNTKFYQL